jgi:hypothetical protein
LQQCRRKRFSYNGTGMKDTMAASQRKQCWSTTVKRVNSCVLYCYLACLLSECVKIQKRGESVSLYIYTKIGTSEREVSVGGEVSCEDSCQWEPQVPHLLSVVVTGEWQPLPQWVEPCPEGQANPGAGRARRSGCARASHE